MLGSRLNRHKEFLVLAFALSAAMFPGRAEAAYANVPWVLNGGALPSVTGRVVLTQNIASQAGSMWNPCSIDLSSDFDMSFAMNFGGSYCGGDGIHFVLQNTGTNALGVDSGDH